MDIEGDPGLAIIIEQLRQAQLDLQEANRMTLNTSDPVDDGYLEDLQRARDRNEDHRLDDPRHGQARDLNRRYG